MEAAGEATVDATGEARDPLGKGLAFHRESLHNPRSPVTRDAVRGRGILKDRLGFRAGWNAVRIAGPNGMIEVDRSRPKTNRRTGTTVPNIESAKKRMRQDVKRHSRNLWRKRRVKNDMTTFLKAVASGDAAVAETEMRKAARTLDKVAATGTIHKNTAARRKSRMAAKVAALKMK